MNAQVMNKQQHASRTAARRVTVFPSKFRLPQLMPQHINRRRLLKMLDAGLDRDLTLLCAPAGFGKSILLAQWYQELRRREIKAAWLKLDSHDEDAIRCLAHIDAAVKSAVNLAGTVKVPKAGYCHHESLEALLHALFNDICHLDSRCVLFLDAYDKAASPGLNQAIYQFLELMPNNFHLVTGSRVVPVELTAPLWGEGRVAQLTAGELCFTETEITDLAEGKKRFPVSSILARTHGWPVAVSSFIEAFKGKENDRQIPERLSQEPPGSIQEFIRDQVLKPLPESARQTLIKTSFLEEIIPKLANRICGHDESSGLLGNLQHLSPLISSKNEPGYIYSVNPLLRECLRQTFDLLTQTEQHYIHTSIIDWYIEHRDIVTALYYAKLAGVPELFVKIVEYFGPHAITIQDGVTSLKLAMEKIQEDSIRSSVRLTISQAVVLIKDGHFSMAERKLEQADRMLDWNREYEDKYFGSVQADYIATQYLLALYKNENFNREYLDRCEIETYQNSAFDGLLGFVHALKSLLYQRNASFSRADAEAGRSLRYYRTARSNYGTASVHLIKGMCCFAKGQLDAAMQSYENALGIITTDFPDDPGLNAIAESLVAEVRYERNELDNINGRLENAINALESYDGWLDTFIVAYRVAGALALSHDDSESAHMVLDRAVLLAAERSLGEVKRLAQLQRINIHIRNGNLTTANTLYKQYSSENGQLEAIWPKQVIWRELDEYYFTTARLLLARQNGQKALMVLEAIVQEARRTGRLLSLTNGHILQALAYQSLDRQTEAIAVMKQAITIGSSEKYLRVFLDQGEGVIPIIQYVIDNEKRGSTRTRLGKYCSRVLSGYRRESREGQALLSFTPRERQVLIGLSHDNSNKLIARDLGITESTIKFHLKKIYSKLGVNKRSTAVIEAKRQQLLS